MRLFTYICLYLLIAAPALASAGGPLEDLRRGVDRGIQILEDSRYKDNSLQSDQQQKLWEVMQKTFDFSEFSRRVLASHYKNFTPQQRDEFSRTFAEFLGKFYLSRLQRRYNGEKIFYIDEKLVSESRALIAIEVLWKKVKVPVELRMIKKDGTWKVYDLTALGINAVANYRAQFQRILQDSSPDRVIDIVREKIRALQKDS
jgi:phospholipid transport system substrate-binding protein